jgi:hypothetical protein
VLEGRLGGQAPKVYESKDIRLYGRGFVSFPAAIAPTIATTVPTFSAVTSRKFGASA